ncbi:benenodin family lasso peptide [Sphingomonas mali]|nr:benenodin family lasso peptide [Sphingomonas mali]
MNREHEDTIELGAVSVETKGLIVGGPDQDNGQLKPFGLSDD